MLLCWLSLLPVETTSTVCLFFSYFSALKQHFYIQFFIVGLLCLTGCNRSGDNTLPTQPPDLATQAAQLTGDALLDSLIQAVTVTHHDSNLVLLYQDIGDIFINRDFEKAQAYYLKAGELSDYLDWNTGRYLYASKYGLLLVRQGLADTALVVLEQADEAARIEKNDTWKGIVAMYKGNAYNEKSWYETALTFYMEALAVFEGMNDTKRLATVYNMLSQLFAHLNNREKAIEFSEKALALNPENLFALRALGRLYGESDYEKGKCYLEQALQLCEEHNNVYMMGMIYYVSGNNALFASNLEEAEMFALQALEKSREIGNTNSSSFDLILLSKIQLLQGLYTQSESNVREALQIAIEFESLQEKKLCCLILQQLALIKGNYHDCIIYEKEYDRIERAIAEETALRASEEMAAKYEMEKKKIRIASLEEEKRLMTWLSITGSGLLLLGLIAMFFRWRLTIQEKRFAEQQHELAQSKIKQAEQQQQLAEARINQLEQEKQIIASQAVLDGEVQERSRLARDLHDGMGGKLTAMKIHLERLKRNVKFENDEIAQFDHAMGMLDDSVQEMRRVSHNLMPETLNRAGLKTAVDDFCRSMSSQIVFNYYGDETRVELKLEALIYRCIHELVNNALKYANASQIMVQIIRESDSISFTVQDDGCGFDQTTETKGIGLQNIRTRVTSFGGEMQIDSKAGEGTEINVTLNVQ